MSDSPEVVYISTMDTIEDGGGRVPYAAFIVDYNGMVLIRCLAAAWDDESHQLWCQTAVTVRQVELAKFDIIGHELRQIEKKFEAKLGRPVVRAHLHDHRGQNTRSPRGYRMGITRQERQQRFPAFDSAHQVHLLQPNSAPTTDEERLYSAQ